MVKSNYRLLIPSDTDILMRIWLDGYKPWYYPGTTDPSVRRAVCLRPGEEKTVDILLEPDPKTVESGCGMPTDQEVP